MAEISLSAYQDKLADLSSDSKFDEVIAHARHILRTFPKNLRAYEQLGGALFATSRWAEATDVLRRLLGARPSDFETHAQLAASYQHLEQFEKAIWHAERALDQQPNNQATISLIRELYRSHRNEEIDRLQLTASALAQQHIRGNLLHEALSTLDQALQRQPERIDLQLLRARTLWLDGQRMEAAETALDILEKLPFAIDANRIMTELWLAEQRPSDAQRYLKHIEEVDPYLAHQLAAGEPAADDLLLLEELDYSSISQREHSIVDPEWLDELSEGGEARTEDGAGGLGALFGMDANDETPAEGTVTADLDDLLSDEQIERLFSELVTGEPVAAVSKVQQEDEVEELLTSMDERGFLDGPVASQEDASDEMQLDIDLDVIAAQMSAADDAAESVGESQSSELDNELASLLEELDSADEDGDWMAEIQQGSLSLEDADASLEYLDDFEREWVVEGDNEESAGAPWLSAAMREAIDTEEDGAFDLFGDDEKLKSLLIETTDTEPIHAADIADWLNPAGEADSNAAEEGLVALDDELLHSPPAQSWLEGDDADVEALAKGDPNERNAQLIDSWQSELGIDDDDDDPYVDWLSEDPGELGDDLSILAAKPDSDAAPADESGSSSAAETARAWGLDDADQLADFVEESAAQGEGSPDWLNAIVPGLDRENDASTDDVNEYARPTSAPGKEFAWVSDIVQEETGEMKAVDPSEVAETLYFRFSKPPAWLTIMQSESQEGNVVAGVAALSLEADIEALDLDDLTFDDYFNFDTPTDKMNVINLDEDTEQLSFVDLDWDDYFDLESPTEKTIAITLDESAADVKFDELGVDDDDFEFESSTDSTPAVTLDAGSDLFDDLSLDDDSATNDRPTWLGYGDLGNDQESDDSDRDGGKSTL